MAKLRKDLKRAKALLKDAHSVAENTQTEGTSNIIMRQLKQQVSTKKNALKILTFEKYFK